MNTPSFRVSFPNVFTAKYNELSKKEEYSIVALFSKGTDLAPMKAAAKEACVAMWGADQTKWPKNLKSPFRDQAEKKREDGTYPSGMEDGGIFMNLKSKNKPATFDQKVQLIINPEDFYPGCYAIATINAYAYDQAGNRGVAFGLNDLQKVGEGEKFSGRAAPGSGFVPVADDRPTSKEEKLPF